MKSLFKWVYLLGLLVAIVVALLNYSAPWLSSLLILAGVLVGIFFFDDSDLTNQGVRYLLLVVVAGSLGAFIGVGSYFTAIFTAVVTFLGPVYLTVLVLHFFKKYFMGKKM